MWGEIEPELRRVLGRLVQPADVDDIVQEVFIRLAARCRRKPLPVEAVVDLAKLAGWNLGLNAVRDAGTRALPRGTVPDVPAATDVEEQAVWHLNLDRVLAAIADMSDADRRVILEALSPTRPHGATKREQDRSSLRLFRARSRLRERVAGVLSGLPVWRWRLRVRPEVAQALGSFGATVVVAVVGVLAPAPSPAPRVAQVVSSSGPAPPPAPVPAAVAASPRAAVPHTGSAVHGGADRGVHVAAATRPPAPRTDVATPENKLVGVPHPAGGEDVATLHGYDRGERVPLACIGGGPLDPPVCVPHPLR
ncbi:MAG TPA: hypothetical protein VHF47_08630 [Acidimicrobiales bacterium]|nr:hypothetical protein [Acidimicrobiales bacterium]